MEEQKVEAGQKYMHVNGRGPFDVTAVANEGTEESKYPTTVVFKSEDGQIWSKPLPDFLDRMTLVVEDEDTADTEKSEAAPEEEEA